MTYKEFIDNIIMDIDEDLSDQELRTRLKFFVNRAYKELSKRQGIYKSKELTPYNNLIKIPMDIIQIFDVLQNGEPIKYQVKGSNINVNTDENIELLYEYMPDPMIGDSDEPVTNAANDEFIIHYSKWLYYAAEQENREASAARSEVEAFRITKIEMFSNPQFIKPIFEM